MVRTVTPGEQALFTVVLSGYCEPENAPLMGAFFCPFPLCTILAHKGNDQIRLGQATY